ncbi:thiamine-phosphate kinase [Thalassolituus sp. LLYu03]|uniref:thiamine-phosphate kinase n=1 Tax=Thalassolituus sp. LLYu03 TaxID=3421656 RepID=UPI003D2978DA
MSSQALGEFELIRRCFASGFPIATDTLLGIGDDCSIIRPPHGYDLAQSIDTQVADVHFPAKAPARLIAQRALRCATSDLAAMGAAPQGFHLALTLPHSDSDWLDDFALGLRDTAHALRMPLLGGDTTRGPLLIVSISVQGWLPAGKGMTRSAARAGDDVWVSSRIGAAALALPLVLENPALEKDLARAYYRPEIQLTLAQRLLPLAHACMDISDGLLQDARHIARASLVDMVIDAAAVPTPVTQDDERWPVCFTGGDDYQLLFTAPADKREDILALNSIPGAACTRIGECLPAATLEPDVRLQLNGEPLVLSSAGYQHFG